MTSTITRMYRSHDKAMAAVAELGQDRAYDGRVHVVAPPGVASGDPGAVDASLESIVAAITRVNVLRARAEIYAEGVLRGGTLVMVHALWGTAMEATEILDRFDPIDAGVPEPEPELAVWDPAAPFSSKLRLPVLSDDPTPFSSFWNLPVLARGRASFSACLGMPELTNAGWSFSAVLGLPLLSDDPAPLSGMLNIPTLSSDAAPLSSLLNLPALSKR